MGQIPIFRKIVQRVWLIVSGLIGPIGWRAISDLLYYFYRGIISYTPATGAFMKEDALAMTHAPAIGRNPATNSRTISKTLNYSHTVVIRNPPTSIYDYVGASTETHDACFEKDLHTTYGYGVIEEAEIVGNGSASVRIRIYVDGVLRVERASNSPATYRFCFISSFIVTAHWSLTGSYTHSAVEITGWTL